MNEDKNSDGEAYSIPKTIIIDDEKKDENHIDETKPPKSSFSQRFLDGWVNNAIAVSSLSIALVVSVFSNIYLIGMLNTKFDEEKIALVPPGLDTTISVRTGQVSEVYLRNIGLIAANLYATFTPKSVGRNVEAILDYASPSFYTRYAKQLRDQADMAKRTEMTQVFVVRDITAKLGRIFVRGEIRRYAYGKEVDFKKDAVIDIKLSYNYKLRRVTLNELSLHDDYNKWINSVTHPQVPEQK